MERDVFENDVMGRLLAAGLPYRPCGLNANWSVSAWHVGPGQDPNHDLEAQLYLLDAEDLADGPFVVVWRTEDRDTGEDRIVEVDEGPLDRMLVVLRDQLRKGACREEKEKR